MLRAHITYCPSSTIETLRERRDSASATRTNVTVLLNVDTMVTIKKEEKLCVKYLMTERKYKTGWLAPGIDTLQSTASRVQFRGRFITPGEVFDNLCMYDSGEKGVVQFEKDVKRLNDLERKDAEKTGRNPVCTTVKDGLRQLIPFRKLSEHSTLQHTVTFGIDWKMFDIIANRIDDAASSSKRRRRMIAEEQANPVLTLVKAPSQQLSVENYCMDKLLGTPEGRQNAINITRGHYGYACMNSQQQGLDFLDSSVADVVAARMRTTQPLLKEEIRTIIEDIVRHSPYPVCDEMTLRLVYGGVAVARGEFQASMQRFRRSAMSKKLNWSTPYSVMSVEAEAGRRLLDRGWTCRMPHYADVLAGLMNVIHMEAFVAWLTEMLCRRPGETVEMFWREFKLHGSGLDRFGDAVARYIEHTGLHLMFHCMQDAESKVPVETIAPFLIAPRRLVFSAKPDASRLDELDEFVLSVEEQSDRTS